MKISVITPVYNCEKYLQRCLDSVLAQQLDPGHEVEVIVVDDGSSDGSGDIADRYASRHDIFHVIHQTNQGVSAARNAALDIATGDYIQFLDSDDFLLHTTCLQHLLQWVEQLQQPDVIHYWMVRIDSHNENNTAQYDNLDSAQVTWQGTGIEACDSDRFDGYPGNKFFRRSLIERLHLRFDTTIHWGEDQMFNLHLYRVAEHTAVVNARIYGYYCSESSTAGTINKSKIKFLLDDIYASTPALKQLLVQFNSETALRSQLFSRGVYVAKRLLILNPPYRQLRHYIAKGFELELFPLRNSDRADKMHHAFDLLLAHPILFKLACWPYRNIAVRLIKPLIAING